MKYFTLFFCLTLPFSVNARKSSEAFIVHAKFDRFSVSSPLKYSKDMSVIIHNDTLVKLIGRLENETQTKVKFISILPRTFKSIDLKSIKGERFFYYPLSPPFQKVELDIGKKFYEIPQKK